MLLTGKHGKPRSGFFRLHRETVLLVPQAIADGRLREGDVVVLLLLAQAAGISCGCVKTSVREIARTLNASPTRIHAALHRLERLDLVRRPGKRRGRYSLLAVSPLVAQSGVPFFYEQHWRYWSRLVDHGDSEPPPEPSPALIAARLTKPVAA
jgi:hypothetical protein